MSSRVVCCRVQQLEMLRQGGKKRKVAGGVPQRRQSGEGMLTKKEQKALEAAERVRTLPPIAPDLPPSGSGNSPRANYDSTAGLCAAESREGRRARGKEGGGGGGEAAQG